MKKTNYFEIVGVLSLSLLLTSSLSVSSCLPEMLETFSSYPRSSVEMLLSIPAFAMVVMIALSPVLSRYLSERIMVTAGLLIMGTAGIVPAFVTSYEVMFAARILMGLGTGLINAKAVSIIGERFTGNLQQKLQGLRCSMETLGQATLTLIAGQLLYLGWNYSFLIYSAAFIILLLYLAFVPQKEEKNIPRVSEKGKSAKLTKNDIFTAVQCMFFGGLMVSTSVVISLRIPSQITDTGIGTAVQASNILTVATLAGFAGGIIFGTLVRHLKRKLLPFSLGMVGIGLLIILFADTLILLALGASICNFFITNSMSFMFSSLPERLPLGALDTANAIVLVGCNLGATLTPFILQAIGLIHPWLSNGFLTYAIVIFILAVGFFLKEMLRRK